MSKQVKVDLLGKNGGTGQIAQQAAGSGGLNIGKLRPFIGKDGTPYVTVYQGGDPKQANSWKTMQVNAGTLRRDEWKMLDEALLQVARSRVTGTQYLLNAGLTFTLGNAMGTTVLEWHSSSDALTAELSMDAVTKNQNDRPEFKTNYLPIPIMHSDYVINDRVLQVSRNMGNGLDTTMAAEAAEAIIREQEDLLFTDTSYKYGADDAKINSFINFSDRITKTDLSDWSSAAVSGADIVEEVLEMKQASIDKKHYGPWVLFIPTNFETKLDEDYSDAKGSNTIRERVLAISNIDDIVVVDALPDSNVVMVQKTTNVVRIVQGLALQNIQWQTDGGFNHNFKAISIQVPQLRSDYNGNTGIVHATVAET